MTEVVYTGGNYPVSVGGVVIARVQSVNINRTRTLTDEYQMGTEESIGQSEGPWSYMVEIALNTKDTQLERALVGEATATNPVNLLDLISASGVSVVTPTRTVGTCIFQSVRYSASVPDTTFNASWQLKGLSISGGGSVSAPATTGVIAFKPRHIMVRFASLSSMGTNVLRVKTFNLTVQARNEDWYEFANSSPWFVDSLSPSVALTLGFYGSRDGASPGTNAYDIRPVPNSSSPDDVEIQLVPDGAAWDDAGNIKFEIPNIVVSDDGTSGSTQSSVDDSLTYSASDPGSTGGFQVTVLS